RAATRSAGKKHGIERHHQPVPPSSAGWRVGSTTGGAVSERVRLRVNGQTRDLEVEVHDTLLEVLRSEFKLTGPREGCGIGLWGRCTVLVDDQPISSCLALAALAADKDILTVEGLADGDRLHPIQEAFIDQMGFQCSYCTPGFILATKALLAEQPSPT